MLGRAKWLKIVSFQNVKASQMLGVTGALFLLA
jgi:hypothetical protein